MAELEINEAYCYDCPEKIEGEFDARVIVHFRPKANWKGIGYGFDWMRIGDYPQIELNQELNHGDTPYQEVICKLYVSKNIGIPLLMLLIQNRQERPLSSEQKARIMAETPTEFVENGIEYVIQPDSNNWLEISRVDKASYKNLEWAYKYARILAKPISGEHGTEYEKYYYSWLSLYPTKKAILSLVIEVLDDKPYTIDFRNDENCYAVNKLKTIDGLPKGKHYIQDAIEVVSMQEHNESVGILADISVPGTDNVFSGGALIAWANDSSKHKQMKVVMVNLKTKESDPLTLGQSNTITLGKCKKEANDLLKQMFVDIENPLSIDLNLSNKKEFKRGGCYNTTGGVLFKNANDRTIKPLYRYLNEECQKKFNEKYPHLKNGYSEYTKLYFPDQPVFSIEVPRGNPVSASHSSIAKHKCIVFNKELEGYILAHELGHVCLLEHPFANKEYHPNAKYTYIPLYTENIMDYTEMSYANAFKEGRTPIIYKVFTFWKWQWEIANKSIR